VVCVEKNKQLTFGSRLKLFAAKSLTNGEMCEARIKSVGARCVDSAAPQLEVGNDAALFDWQPLETVNGAVSPTATSLHLLAAKDARCAKQKRKPLTMSDSQYIISLLDNLPTQPTCGRSSRGLVNSPTVNILSHRKTTPYFCTKPQPCQLWTVHK